MKPLLPALCLLLASSPLARQEDSTSVLVVVLDDIALSDLDLIETPNIDWLASQGVSFRRAYAMPLCQQSRYGLFTGRYAGGKLGDSCGTATRETPSHAIYSLPKVMKGLGYATGLFGKWHLGSNRLGAWELAPHLHGFDTWRAGVPQNVIRCGGVDYWNWTRVDDGVVTASQDYQTTAARDELLSWWRTTVGSKFACLALQAPHAPYHAPPPNLLPPDYPAPADDREAYVAMIVSADTVVGQVLDAVSLHDTWVILIGDNGTPDGVVGPGQAPNKVKGTTFEGGVNVPLVIAGPGVARGFETRSLAHVTDVLPTVAELVGTEVPARTGIDGVSLVPTLRRPATRVRSHVYCVYDSDPLGRRNVRVYDRSVVSERWKLRWYTDTRKLIGKDVQLYDLHEDPHENAPLDPRDPAFAEVVPGLRKVLQRYEIVN